MTDFTRLIDWFENKNIDDIDEDFGDFTDGEIQTALFNFGINKSSQPQDVAGEQLEPVLLNRSSIADDLFKIAKESRSVSRQISNIEDLDTLEKLIDKDIQPLLSRRIGIERAKRAIKRDVFSSEADKGIEFLRVHSPQTLGGLRRQQIRRAGALVQLPF